MRECEICGVWFQRIGKSRRRTCSKSCAVALSWRNEQCREDRMRNISATKQTPAGKAVSRRVNAMRWSDPKQHEKLSKESAQRWKDEEYRNRSGASIRAAWDDDKRRSLGAKIKASRAHWDETRRQQWRDKISASKKGKHHGTLKKEQAQVNAQLGAARLPRAQAGETP